LTISKTNAWVSWLTAGVLSIGLAATATAANRVAEIRARGMLNCGIWPHVPGFAIEQEGRYSGFEVDICRAVATAIFGDPDKVGFVSLAHVAEFTGRTDIDLVVRRLTWTLRRETASGFAFGPVIFYDGQGFLAPKDSGINSPSKLAGQRVCVAAEEHHAQTLRDYFQEHGLEIALILVDNDHAAETALRRNDCRAYSADVSSLAAARSTFVGGAMGYDILPEMISKEPLAPMVRAEDTELMQIVRWTIFVMIQAEELGLSSRNVDDCGQCSSPMRRFLGVHPGSSVALGAGEWSRAIIAGVGNYGEVFDRNLGADSAIKLDRGLNRLWNHGGLMYAPPLDR